MLTAAPTVYTVSEISQYLKKVFARDHCLMRVRVSGEISNLKYHSSGHIYFTLKDSQAQLKCVMFASDRGGLTAKLEDGQQIEAEGQISVFEKGGIYQLYAKKIALTGSGLLYEQFLVLKEKLSDMGMFDPMYKKPIPAFTRSIGVVTSLTGAALKDIINVSTRRDPHLRIVICPARVQGEGAAMSVARGIERLDRLGLDLIIVGRGGGAIEDLWAFNEEITARAIFDARTPIISAVGHETDFTIADFTADMRAPTPSAAAELATFVYDEFREMLTARENALLSAVYLRLGSRRQRLSFMQESLMRRAPSYVLSQKKRELSDKEKALSGKIRESLESARKRDEELMNSLGQSMRQKLQKTAMRERLLAARLEGASPLRKLSGGCGYIRGSSGKPVLSAKDVSEGESLDIYLSDGRIEAAVTAVERTENGWT